MFQVLGVILVLLVVMAQLLLLIHSFFRDSTTACAAGGDEAAGLAADVVCQPGSAVGSASAFGVAGAACASEAGHTNAQTKYLLPANLSAFGSCR